MNYGLRGRPVGQVNDNYRYSALVPLPSLLGLVVGPVPSSLGLLKSEARLERGQGWV